MINSRENIMPRKLIQANYTVYSLPEKLYTPFHIHDHSDEFIYVIKGRITANLPSGETQVIQSGDFAFFNGSLPHETTGEFGTEMFLIHMDTAYLIGLIRKAPLLPDSIKYNNQFAHFKNNSDEAAELSLYIRNLIEDIKDANHETLYGVAYMLMGFFIKNSVISVSETSQSALITKLAPALNYIHSHFREKLSVEYLSSLSGYNRDYFTRLFIKATGHSAIDYINLLKLKEGRYQLLNTNKSIAEIGCETGFGSGAYFARQFKKNYSITPADFRRWFNHYKKKSIYLID